MTRYGDRRPSRRTQPASARQPVSFQVQARAELQAQFTARLMARFMAQLMAQLMARQGGYR